IFLSITPPGVLFSCDETERERGLKMSIEIGIALTILSVVIAFMGYQLKRQSYQSEQHDGIKKDATRDAVIETKLDNISNGVDSIRIDLRSNEKKVSENSQRLTRVEESTKQAHKRIDALDNNRKSGRD